MNLRLSALLSIALYALVGISTCEAQTYAYVPRSDGYVTRISTDDSVIEPIFFRDNPYGAAVTPQGDFLLVTRPGANSVTRVSTSSFTSTSAQKDLPVGRQPQGVAVESRGLYAYVTNYGDPAVSGTVSEINISSFTVSDTIDVGKGPLGVAATYDEADQVRKVYVANNADNSISVISGSNTETITAVGIGPSGVALSPDGAYLYVALCSTKGAVAIIRTSDNTVVDTLPAGDSPWGVAVGSDGDFVYVTNSLSDTVTVIDGLTRSVYDTYSVGDKPMGVACPKNGDFAYVVNQDGNSISKIDINAGTVEEIGAEEIKGGVGLGAFIGGTPPSAPSELEAETSGHSSIDLTWTDNASDESGFKIERRPDGEDRYTQVDKVSEDTTSYTDTGLDSDTTYTYRVRAYNEAADSDYSGTAEATTDEGPFSWCFIQTLLY